MPIVRGARIADAGPTFRNITWRFIFVFGPLGAMLLAAGVYYFKNPTPRNPPAATAQSASASKVQDAARPVAKRALPLVDASQNMKGDDLSRRAKEMQDELLGYIQELEASNRRLKTENDQLRVRKLIDKNPQ